MERPFLEFLETCPERDHPAAAQAIAGILACFRNHAPDLEVRLQEFRDLIWELRGPTPIPGVNAVWHQAQLFFAGEIPLERLRQGAETEKLALQWRVGPNPLSNRLDDLGSPELQGVNQLREVLNDLTQLAHRWKAPKQTGTWLEQFLAARGNEAETDRLLDSLVNLKAAMDQAGRLEVSRNLSVLLVLAEDALEGFDVQADLDRTWRALESKAQQPGQLACVACGQPNPARSARCHFCHLQVNREESAPGLRHQNFQHFYELAADTVESGQAEAYQAELELLKARLSAIPVPAARALAEAASLFHEQPSSIQLERLWTALKECETALLNA